MKKSVITINGVQYPSRFTMGAMLEFKQQTGKEVTELQGNDISLAVALLFCCITSACRIDGVQFPYSTPIEMADHMDADEFANWQNDEFSATAESDAEKKKV